MEEEIKGLSNSELAERLRACGESVGPIIGSTRKLYEKKLLKRMGVGSDPPPPSTDGPDNSSASNTNGTQGISQDDGGNSSGDLGVPPSAYFGVQLPMEARPNAEEKCVLTEKSEVIKLMKKYPGARFKVFSKQDDANNFACLSPEQVLASPKPPVPNDKKEGKPPPAEGTAFRGPKPQDLVKLRRLIETGNLEDLKNLVWSNPRYLISSGDTPTILQEGFRYNALHSCALKNQAAACQLILDTLEDPTFIKLLYPEDSEEARWNRIHFLVDLYLNMPDKGNNESALHFACKFGHVEVVKVLSVHPRIDKELKNKYGEAPRDVICSRATKPSKEMKDKVLDLLEDQYYVPLYRYEENSLPPKIGKPWSPTVDGRVMDTGGGGNGDSPQPPTPQKHPASPKEMALCVKAYAGPMSPSKAKVFQKTWLTPPSPSPSDRRKLAEIRRGDSDKGLERIGRQLANDQNVTWTEYWDFLNCFTNITSTEGLQLLEDHLKEQEAQEQKKACWENNLNEMSEELQQLKLDDSSAETNISKEDLNKTPNFVQYMANVPGVDEARTVHPVTNLRGTCTDSFDLKPTALFQNPLPLDLCTEGENCDSLARNNNNEHRGNGQFSRKNLERQTSGDSHDDSISSFVTAHDDLDLDYMDAMIEQKEETKPICPVFISGPEPSKTDLDVFRAMSSTPVPADSFPRVHQWCSRVEAYSEQARKQWHTPRRPVLRAQSTPRRAPLHLPSKPVIEDSPSFDSSSASSTDNSSISHHDDTLDRVRTNLMVDFAKEKNV